jgi:hypothetical protein
LEKDKIAHLKGINGQKERNIVEDEDYFFHMSLLPHLRPIPHHKKLMTRIKLQQVVLEDQQLVHHLPPLDVSSSRSSTPLQSPSSSGNWSDIQRDDMSEANHTLHRLENATNTTFDGLTEFLHFTQ